MPWVERRRRRRSRDHAATIRKLPMTAIAPATPSTTTAMDRRAPSERARRDRRRPSLPHRPARPLEASILGATERSRSPGIDAVVEGGLRMPPSATRSSRARSGAAKSRGRQGSPVADRSPSGRSRAAWRRADLHGQQPAHREDRGRPPRSRPARPLYFLRDRVGKAATLRERRTRGLSRAGAGARGTLSPRWRPAFPASASRTSTGATAPCASRGSTRSVSRPRAAPSSPRP